jgi:hypothetical protein
LRSASSSASVSTTCRPTALRCCICRSRRSSSALRMCARMSPIPTR